MLFAVIATDRPGSAALRQATRPSHVDYVKTFGPRVQVAGPFLSEDGTTMLGSLIIIEAASRADAEAFSANDPYTKAGLFDSVDIRPWAWTIGGPK